LLLELTEVAGNDERYAARSLATIAISIQEASLCPSKGPEHFPAPETIRSVHIRLSVTAWLA
jgi:hypothetical protein